MTNFPQVPNGLTTTQVNVGVYVNEASVRHEQTQKAQLADIRAREAPPSPAALMTKEKYLQLGSGEKITEHWKQMAETREKINAASLGMEALEKASQTSTAVDTPPRSSSIFTYSGLKRVTSAPMRKRAFSVGVLSLPTDDEPNMTRAMQTPHSRAERGKVGKNKGSQRSLKKLLDKNKLNARIGMQHLANVQHLLQKAKQNHEVVTYRRAQRLEALQANGPRLIELVKEREVLFAKQRSSAPSHPLGLPEPGLESAIDANAAAIAELLNQVTPGDQVIAHLPALMKAVAAGEPPKNAATYDSDAITEIPDEITAQSQDPKRESKQPENKYDALTRALGDLLPLNQDLIDDLKAAEQDLENAEALVERATTYTDTQSESAKTLRNKDCQDIIAALPGFNANADSATLSGQLTTLFNRLQAQNAPAKDALDGAQVFQLAYQAIADTLSTVGGDADPARAAALLEHLLAPADSADAGRHFETVIGMVMGNPNSDQLPATEQRSAAINDMDAVLQALAPLRRGMEVIHRITAEDGHAPNLQARGMARRDQTVKIFLTAGKTRAEKDGAINPSTMQLLDTAQKGARKAFYSLDVAPAEGIALAAARNRFTEAGTGTELQYVADRLTKFKDEWLPRAVKRADSVTGSIGQGSHTGIMAPVDMLPTTGKTPVSETTLQLAARTSTSYGIDPVKTGGQIDDYVRRSSRALQAAATALVRADPSTMDVLLQCAAAQIAQERITAQTDQKIRPEHYALDASDSAVIQERFLELARQAGVVTAGQESQNLSNQSADQLPEHIAMPLKAESLFQWKTALQTQLTPQVPEDDPARQAMSAAVGMVRRLENLMDTSSAPKIKTQEDIYTYLAAKIEQLQLRGKLRMTGGGVVGANAKLINWTMKVAEEVAYYTQLAATLGSFAVSGGPRVRLDGQFGRNAVFEISMSTVGFEITIASEKKASSAAGAGASGSVGNALVKGSVAADKALVGDRILQQGVKFMIPRSVTKEYTDDAMRLEARKLFDLIFQMQMAEDGQVERMNFDASNNNEESTGIPNNLAQIFAECPHVSVAVIDDMSDRSRKQETGLNASVKATPLLDSVRAGLTIGGGVRNTHLDWRAVEVSEKSGYHNVERHNYATGGQIAITGGVGVTAIAGNVEDAAIEHTFSVGLPGVSVSHQVKLAGKDAKLRLVSIDGKTDAVNTRRDVEHSSVTSLEQSIRTNFEAWVQLGVVELFKTSEYKEYKDAPLAEKRRVVAEHLNNTIRELEEKDHAEDGRRVLRNVFAESYRLVDSAAAQYDSLRDAQTQAEARLNKLQTELKAAGNAPHESRKALKTALNTAILEARTERENSLDMQNALLQHEASWMPWKLTASERTLENQQKGVDIAIQMGLITVAEGQRPMKSWPA
ncbi:hypothetical protein [Noviherbaspirillum saxi]|uniref:Uncharacterized protein n=1 Tax=Noviherbaspirillum saxi TaxID=2320863 RepID=A0A3A3FG37_9BURK|nr:hypothetical protein [Noviherbaspirillum saxi]RJF92331.1 hypothetical protein D3871_27285 [Noviherbaspirillum saxi]